MKESAPLNLLKTLRIFRKSDYADCKVFTEFLKPIRPRATLDFYRVTDPLKVFNANKTISVVTDFFMVKSMN